MGNRTRLLLSFLKKASRLELCLKVIAIVVIIMERTVKNDTCKSMGVTSCELLVMNVLYEGVGEFNDCI